MTMLLWCLQQKAICLLCLLLGCICVSQLSSEVDPFYADHGLLALRKVVSFTKTYHYNRVHEMTVFEIGNCVQKNEKISPVQIMFFVIVRCF